MRGRTAAPFCALDVSLWRGLTGTACDGTAAALLLVEMELNDAVLDLFDVEGVLGFAEHVVGNAARLWMELGLEQRQQLQQVLFPEGLKYDGEKFGTVVTCLAFKQMDENLGGESTLASPTGSDDFCTSVAFTVAA